MYLLSITKLLVIESSSLRSRVSSTLTQPLKRGINNTQKNFIFFKKYFYRVDLDLNSIQGFDNLELIFKIINPNKVTLTNKNNSNLEITKNQIIWNLNQGQINSLEFSFWNINKLLIGISTILMITILAYLLRFYRFKLGTDLPQLPSK